MPAVPVAGLWRLAVNLRRRRDLAGPAALRSFELAGEIADGLHTALSYSPTTLGFVVDHVKIGAERAGRSWHELDLAAWIVSVVCDGGRSWSAPVLLGAADAVSDKPTIVADPRHAGIANEIWRNQAFGLPVGDRGATRLYFALTHDGGATWQGSFVIRQASPGGLASVCGQSIAGGDTGAAAGQQTVDGGHTVALVTIDGSGLRGSGGFSGIFCRRRSVDRADA